MSESTRNRIAWTVAGLSLLALVLVMRVLLPPPAMAGMESAEGSAPEGAQRGAVRTSATSAVEGVGLSSAPLPATAAEAERAQQVAAAAAARAVGPRAPARGAEQGAAADRAAADGRAAAVGGAAAPVIAARPDYVSELEWQALKGVAAQSRDPARTLAALVEKLRFGKQLDLFRSAAGAEPRAGVPVASRPEVPVVSRADLANRLLADLPARVAAGDMSRDEALGLLPSLVAPLEPDPASRAARVHREAAQMPGQALQAVP